MRLKSAEDLLLGREYINRQGDYRTAAEIWQQALAVDPDNVELKQALAEAMAKQYMTPERFAQVQEGNDRGAGHRR